VGGIGKINLKQLDIDCEDGIIYYKSNSYYIDNLTPENIIF